MSALVAQYDALIMDADGVLYRGNEPVEHAVDVLGRIEGSTPWCVLTNNAGHPPERVADRLTALGLPIEADRIVTSPQGAARYLQDLGTPPGAHILVVGGDGIDHALHAADFLPVRQRSSQIAAVVQGLGTDLTWTDLAEASYAVADGAVWIATNLDPSLPTAHGFAPGNGALVAAVERATGRTPQAATGKPEPLLFHLAADRLGSQQPLVVGDRIDTDIRGGNRARMDTLLVLTGVTRPAQLSDLAWAPLEDRPTYLGADLRSLLAPVEQVVIGGQPSATDRTSVVIDEPAWLPRVRLLLARAWNEPDAADDAAAEIRDCVA